MTHLNHRLSQLAHDVSRHRRDRGHSGRWLPQGDVRDRRTEFHDGEMIEGKNAREKLGKPAIGKIGSRKN